VREPGPASTSYQPYTPPRTCPITTAVAIGCEYYMLGDNLVNELSMDFASEISDEELLDKYMFIKYEKE
jgi:hypothetical protein